MKALIIMIWFLPLPPAPTPVTLEQPRMTVQQQSPIPVIEPEFLPNGTENPLYTGPKEPMLTAPKPIKPETRLEDGIVLPIEDESYPLIAPR